MSNITQRLLVLPGMTSDRNTVLKFCEPKGTSRDTLFNRLLFPTLLQHLPESHQELGLRSMPCP
jgi:hypothetical protein